MAQAAIGVIGGSGLYAMADLAEVEEAALTTPFGEPSAPYVLGTLAGKRVAFLPRHGRGHVLMPGEIPFRANIHGFKQLGCEWIISVSAVGSLKEEIHPGDIVIPDQFIDLTKDRPATFFGGGVVAHVSMADPVCRRLSNILEAAARRAGAAVHAGGTYVCMEGPQFSSRAESFRYRGWEASVIGMTNMPEAKLAREAELSYATIALATDYDCWHEEEEDVSVEAVVALIRRNAVLAQQIIREAVPAIGGASPFAGSLAAAIITDRAHISPEARKRLDLLIGKYLA
ncbi:MAG: S-methyl-5'-thioadenosine phosphorylase [Candidatus Tectomicrobia bacterium]|uniref:S-methyl-5'-thioadenosine phosphorylase n=1 Tax=Tectimicrobiota bacterium TaxID=2528274 RepID=A0A932ZV07_UNCTE|nr:S-methyl-5'-thioadenosine phosphorylase [Candidatus Tectomicrobia bacterium]